MNSILNHIQHTGVVAILRGVAPLKVVPLGRTLRKAGVGAIEVTLNSQGAFDGIAELRAELGTALPVGAGTVMNAEAARRAIEAGAMFLLSPHLAEDVLEVALGKGVPAIVGIMTPTEAVRAYKLGATMVKVFPAGTLGPNFFRELKGPLPQITTMAVGGVNQANAADFINAGAVAIGAGSQLLDMDAINRDDWAAVEAKAAAMVTTVRIAKEKKQ